MSTPRRNGLGRRPGFTLIELLVVMAIIAFLAALLVLIGPAILKSDQSSRGAQSLQGILFIAKQQALRDRNPYGIRLLRESNNPTNPDGTPNLAYSQVRSFQYIQQPGNFTGGQVMVTQGSTDVKFTVDLTGGLGADSTLWPVQPGDYLQVSTDAYHLIKVVGVTSGGTPDPQSLVLAYPYSGASTATPTDQYRIARGPRPVAGEDTIFLPDDVVVDMGANRSILTPDPATGNLDILFMPSGAIQGPAGRSGKIILWVRDADPNNPSVSSSPGDQTLITIFTRTGQIGAYPVDLNGPDPYSFTLDPRPAGL